jgi:ketosteroid isomerase-like protein
LGSKRGIFVLVAEWLGKYHLRLMKTSTILLLALALPSLAFGQTKDAAKPSAETENELMKMEQDMSNALIKADAAAIEKMIAEDCFLTAPDGTTQNKAQFMADVKSGDLKIQSQKIADMKVHGANADAVFVTYVTTDKGTYKGKDISGQFRWTDVFVKRDGRWMLVASQGTGVDEPKG